MSVVASVLRSKFQARRRRTGKRPRGHIPAKSARLFEEISQNYTQSPFLTFHWSKITLGKIRRFNILGRLTDLHTKILGFVRKGKGRMGVR